MQQRMMGVQGSLKAYAQLAKAGQPGMGALDHPAMAAQANALHAWLTAPRQKVPPGSATAKAIDYSLGHWRALVRYIEDGDLPADNNWVEIKSDRLLSGATIGCSSVRFAPVNVLRRS